MMAHIILTACRAAGLGAMLLLASACAWSGDQDKARVTVIEEGQLAVQPIGVRLTYASATARATIAKSLVGLDEQGRVVPALAARWIVTDDGLSYIFRLHQAKWDDGREVTAERVAKVLRDRVRELRDSRLGPDLEVIDEIISMTGSVIEIQLDAPHPNFLQLMAQPELGLFRVGHSAGPMSIIANDDIVTFGPFRTKSEAEEESDDEEQPKDDAQTEDDPRRVTLRRDDAASAVARFAAGHIDVVLNGKFHHLPLLDQAGLGTDVIQLDPVAGMFGFIFVRADGFWAVPQNREILSMAINRPALLTSYDSVSAWKSRQKIVPEALDVEGINTRADWSRMTMEARVQFARQQVANWRSGEGAITPLVVTIPDGPGADILFLRVRADLRRVGLDMRRAKPGEQPHARFVDRIAPHDSAPWFLSQLTCDKTPMCLNDADSKIAEADAATNLEIRARLYAEAEAMLVKHYNYIPIGVPIRWSLVRAGQPGFAVNPRGWHPLNTLVGIPIS